MKSLLIVLSVLLMVSDYCPAADPGGNDKVRNLSGVYLNAGHVFLYRAWKADLSVVFRDRWILSAHVFGGTVHDAPGKPKDYMAPIALPSGGGGGGGLLGPLDTGIGGWWASSYSNSDQPFQRSHPSRIVWTRALTAGRLWTMKGQDFMLRVDGGPAFLRVDEARNFQWQDRSQLKGSYATGGHIFQRHAYNTLGFLCRTGADYRLNRIFGFSLGLEALLAKRLLLPGLYVGIRMGFLG
jgi:hypothetical protein